MKYLDENIIASAQTLSIAGEGIYQYQIKKLVESASTYTLLFVGSIYHSRGQIFSVNITNVIASDAWGASEEDLYPISENFAKQIKLVNTYKVEFYSGSTLLATSATMQVAKVYRYPHYLSSMQSNVFFDYNERWSVSFPLQGRYNVGGYGYYQLTPRYPYLNTDNYRLVLVSEESLNLSAVTGHFLGAYSGQISLNLAPPSSVASFKLSTLYNNMSITEFDGTFENVMYFNNYNTISIHEDNLVIEENEDFGHCYFRFVEIDKSGNIIKEFFTWKEANEIVTTTILIDSDFIQANKDGRLFVIFSPYTNEYTYIENDDIVSISLNREMEYYINQSITLTTELNEVDYGVYILNNLKFVLKASEGLSAKLEVGGDYVAEIDTCISDYYLQWVDRMGGVQSQPFNKHYTYSENITKDTTIDYAGKKRINNIQVASNFTINTDWINEKYYPYYESIFTSPILFLYDTKEDKKYTVLVKDNEYTEKTFANQKKLFNLTLNLEINTVQNITY